VEGKVTRSDGHVQAAEEPGKTDIALLYPKHGFGPTLAAMTEIVAKHVKDYAARYDDTQPVEIACRVRIIPTQVERDKLTPHQHSLPFVTSTHTNDE
jgi:ribosomal protein L15